jgi:hypothetical protein
MVKAKAKKGFNAKSSKAPKSKPTIAKKQTQKDPMEMLISKSSALSFSDEKKKTEKKGGRKKPTGQAKARRSVVRKQHKQRSAGAKRKQRRKGIN